MFHFVSRTPPPRSATALLPCALFGLLISSSCQGPLLPGPRVSRPEAPTRVAYRDTGVPLVEVHLPGHGRGWFILDSGSSHSLLDQEWARSVGLIPRTLSQPLTTVRDGEVIASLERYAAVPELRCGDAVARGLHAPLVDLTGVPGEPAGLLGQDVLGEWTVLFLPETQTLSVCPDLDTARELLGPGHSARDFPSLPGPRRVPVVEWTVDGHTVSAVVDTGATHCALPPELLRELGAPRVAEGRWRGLEGSRDCTVHRLTHQRLGLRSTPGSAHVIGAPGARIGFSMMSAGAFVLDGPGHALWLFEEATTVAAGGGSASSRTAARQPVE